MRADPKTAASRPVLLLFAQLYTGNSDFAESPDVKTLHVTDARDPGGKSSPIKASVGSPARQSTKRKASSAVLAEEEPRSAQALAKVCTSLGASSRLDWLPHVEFRVYLRRCA